MEFVWDVCFAHFNEANRVYWHFVLFFSTNCYNYSRMCSVETPAFTVYSLKIISKIMPKEEEEKVSCDLMRFDGSPYLTRQRSDWTCHNWKLATFSRGRSDVMLIILRFIKCETNIKQLSCGAVMKHTALICTGVEVIIKIFKKKKTQLNSWFCA